MNRLLLVDEQDRIIGDQEKLAAHRQGQLHRAFSLFFVDRKEKKLLLQRRAMEKYHSGGRWSNTSCSHPYKDETWEEAFTRCIFDEWAQNVTLSFEADPKEAFSVREAGTFLYFSDYGELKEHEIDHVFVVTADLEHFSGETPDPSEIMDAAWVAIDEIDKKIQAEPDTFSTWFQPAYTIMKKSMGW